VRVIETAIDIGAAAQRVWEVLTRFDAYPDWNPFVISIAGAPRAGAKLKARIKPPGRAAMTFHPTIIAAIEQQQLTWLGRLLVPGLFDGEHSFRIESRGPACRFHQSERFSGLLVPLFGTGLFDATRQGFDAMNAALKERAEAAIG